MRGVLIMFALCGCSLPKVGSSNPEPDDDSGNGPREAHEYQEALWERCFPSCYKLMTAEDDGDGSTGCGYRDLMLDMSRSPGGSWDDPQVRQGNTTPVIDCKVPPSAKRWSKVVRQAAELVELEAGDTIVAFEDEDWQESRRDDGVSNRSFALRLYSKKLRFKASPCGPDPSVVCELNSRVARALNTATFRIKQAKKLQKAKRQNACRTAAYDAIAFVRGAKSERKERKQAGDWDSGLVYMTKYDGKLDEDELFELLRERNDEALELFQACGGDEPPFNNVSFWYSVEKADRRE